MTFSLFPSWQTFQSSLNYAKAIAALGLIYSAKTLAENPQIFVIACEYICKSHGSQWSAASDCNGLPPTNPEAQRFAVDGYIPDMPVTLTPQGIFGGIASFWVTAMDQTTQGCHCILAPSASPTPTL